MKLRDQLSVLFWLAISFFVCVESIKVNIGTLQSPGPGFLPFWSGVVLGILAIILLVNSILKEKKPKATDLWKGMKWDKVVLTLLSLFLYIFLLPKLGYFIATFGLMTFMFGLIRRSKLWIQGVIALFSVFVTYFIFYICLDIQLPKGIFGF